MRIEGSTILVTGASSGIGASLAPQLAARGATVGIVARRRDRLEEVLERCVEHTPASRLWAVDLGDLDAAVQLVDDAWDAFGGLDALVNNAAIPKRVPVPRLTDALVDETMRINFTSPVRMTLAVLPRWLERGSGCVVNVSSMGGRIGIAHEAAYCASKFALCGWSEAMAIDVRGTGVEVKLALPGPIETEIWDLPGNDPALYSGPFVSAEACAASIVDAIEDDGFEFYVPPEFPGGLGAQHDMVVGKTTDVDAFIDLMGQMAGA
ncbi:MAG TPA: SDR family NAD(P)-dependent oxidoreductase [Acidimicrobiia bacterium]|nr:SDR family NAD(P)-dependent oxidoreductase [Acidimicrobiia bacterium]